MPSQGWPAGDPSLAAAHLQLATRNIIGRASSRRCVPHSTWPGPAPPLVGPPTHTHHIRTPQRLLTTSPAARDVLRPSAPDLAVASRADLTVEDAWALLHELTRQDVRGQAAKLLGSADKRRRLRDALLIAASSSLPSAGWVHDADPAPEVLLGLMASDVRLAVRALRDWCAALGLPLVAPVSRVPGVDAVPSITGAVYIKYNSRTALCYVSRYDGRDRGVLVQLGAVQVGHLPLGLHDEAMEAAPPTL